MAKITKEEALRYHAEGKPGKIEVIPTKPHSTQTDLSLAYSPGVAEPCLEIEKNPLDAYEYTAKGNLVAVISNGTAVLGLGDIGPLAGKPVMEGKGLLFKIFAGIDVFDIEVNEKDPEKFIQTVKAISPTFGGINLEDIKAPECFEIETRLKNELDIPVICYGLRADFKGDLFPGSEALLVMADKIEEVKTICWCGKKATFNARFDAAGKVLKEGEQVVLGANDRYTSLCRRHWMAGDLGPDFDIHKV